MMLHDNFEWDENKAAKNLRKHRVSFDDAALVLADEEGDAFHVEEYDDEHSSAEDRYVTTASHPGSQHRPGHRLDGAFDAACQDHQNHQCAAGKLGREEKICQRNPRQLNGFANRRGKFRRLPGRIWTASVRQ
jgi:Ribonuclease toxin, BrnT, of type II toxin-antitoxin system